MFIVILGIAVCFTEKAIFGMGLFVFILLVIEMVVMEHGFKDRPFSDDCLRTCQRRRIVVW